MLRAVVFGIMVLGMAGTACGGKNNGNGGNNRNVQKGSGKACPQFNGVYKCTDEATVRIRSGQNDKGQPIVNLQSEQDYITDGEVHEYQEDGETVRYSVDCQADSMGLHLAASGGTWAKAKLTRISEKRIRMESSGQDADGQAFPPEDLTCELN